MSLNPNHLDLIDEPIESILFDSPVQKTSDADGIDESEQLLEEIGQCAYSGNQVRMFALMKWLLQSELPVSVDACRMITHAFRRVVSSDPKPVLSEVVIEYGFLLDKVIDLTTQLQADDIRSTAETIRYRMCEALGEFDKARTLIGSLRERADKEDSLQLAQLTNNYGYEYLLEGNFSAAQPYFVESLAVFEGLNSEIEIANGQANLLTCQFALSSSRDWETLMPTLRAAHRVLLAEEDWRIRKTMRLFAARAEARGRQSVAIGWARRAVDASHRLVTQLHLDDEMYLNELRGKPFQGHLFEQTASTRHDGDNPEYRT